MRKLEILCQPHGETGCGLADLTADRVLALQPQQQTISASALRPSFFSSQAGGDSDAGGPSRAHPGLTLVASTSGGRGGHQLTIDLLHPVYRHAPPNIRHPALILRPDTLRPIPTQATCPRLPR